MLEGCARTNFVANVERIFHISSAQRTFVHAEGLTDNLPKFILHTRSSQHCYFSTDFSLVSNIALLSIRLPITIFLSLLFLETELQWKKTVKSVSYCDATLALTARYHDIGLPGRVAAQFLQEYFSSLILLSQRNSKGNFLTSISTLLFSIWASFFFSTYRSRTVTHMSTFLDQFRGKSWFNICTFTSVNEAQWKDILERWLMTYLLARSLERRQQGCLSVT